MQEYIDYDLDFRSGRIPAAVLEDEIFQKCVLDPNVKLNTALEKAGLVTTVVDQIMQFSGPAGPEQIAQDLNTARHLINNFLNDAISIIMQTFPAYTMDCVFNMEYHEFLKLFAMAERRLLQMGVIQEPIQPVIVNNEEGTKKIAEVKFKDLNPEDPQHDPYWRKESKQHRKQKSTDTVISGSESGQLMKLPEGMTPEDREVYMHLHADQWKHDALDGLDLIYPDLMDKLKKGERITPDTIRETRGVTPEEVKAKRDEYKKNLASGKIKYRPSQQVIATSDNEGAKPKARRSKG